MTNSPDAPAELPVLPTAAGAPHETWPDGKSEPRREALPSDDERLIIDVAGFEGPLDLLLELARQHKVDLSQISILDLADQYIAYVDRARAMRLELAADYLVMAAWLTYLKSRLLIPLPPSTEGEASPQDMAARLAFRLQRLQAMRERGGQLMERSQLGIDVFFRGAPEPLVIERQREYGDTLMDLLKAYAERRARKMVRQTYTVKRQPVWSIKEARETLERLVGTMDDWGTFDLWLERYLATPELRRSVRASSFTASLELVREGVLELRQDDVFKPIYVRRRHAAA
ncbi:MAG: segregation/condensation protein A [Phyllobacteriaceae bacterium]|nr:segregation/condensation protein A [Phyllobacteriaceae bacterium]